MAKRPDLSGYQRGIVKRYYRHQDSILVTRLQEIVSELALAEGKAADRQWKRARQTLDRLACDPPLPASRVEPIFESRDVPGFAQLVSELALR